MEHEAGPPGGALKQQSGNDVKRDPDQEYGNASEDRLLSMEADRLVRVVWGNNEEDYPSDKPAEITECTGNVFG